MLGEDAEVRVARSELRPGVADADDRTSIELVLRHAAVLDPAAVDEAVDVLTSEPLNRSLFHLIGRPTTGNIENTRGGERAVLAREPAGERGDLLHFDETPHRDLGEHELGEFG